MFFYFDFGVTNSRKDKKKKKDKKGTPITPSPQSKLSKSNSVKRSSLSTPKGSVSAGISTPRSESFPVVTKRGNPIKNFFL